MKCTSLYQEVVKPAGCEPKGHYISRASRLPIAHHRHNCLGLSPTTPTNADAADRAKVITHFFSALNHTHWYVSIS